MNPNPSLPEGMKPKRLLRNFLLDARFQLKFTSLVVGGSAVVAVLLGVFLSMTSRSLLTEAETAVAARSRAADTSREIGASAMNNELLKRFDDPTFQAQLQEQSKALDAAYERERSEIVAQHKQLVRQQRAMMAIITLGLFGLVVMLALGSIIATHRIVGPIYRIKRMMQDAAAGVAFDERSRLRKGDEFQDLFDEFVRMLGVMQARQDEVQGLILQAIEQAERAGAVEAAARLREISSKLKGLRAA